MHKGVGIQPDLAYLYNTHTNTAVKIKFYSTDEPVYMVPISTVCMGMVGIPRSSIDMYHSHSGERHVIFS